MYQGLLTHSQCWTHWQQLYFKSKLLFRLFSVIISAVSLVLVQMNALTAQYVCGRLQIWWSEKKICPRSHKNWAPSWRYHTSTFSLWKQSLCCNSSLTFWEIHSFAFWRIRWKLGMNLTSVCWARGWNQGIISPETVNRRKQPASICQSEKIHQ